MNLTKAQQTGNPTSTTKDKGKGWYSRGYLPHFDVSGLYQAITYRLEDSLPGGAGVPPASSSQTNEKKAEQRKQIEQNLNKGYGSCLLKDKEIAKIVVDAWKYFHGKRYDLVAYVVMPNHVHVLIKTYEGFPLSKVIHSWKSFTAHTINTYLKGRAICGRDARAPYSSNPSSPSHSSSSSSFSSSSNSSHVPHSSHTSKVWQYDYFDRFIRDEQHFAQAIAYIHENPVNAGLCRHASDWPWSSVRGK